MKLPRPLAYLLLLAASGCQQPAETTGKPRVKKAEAVFDSTETSTATATSTATTTTTSTTTGTSTSSSTGTSSATLIVTPGTVSLALGNTTTFSATSGTAPYFYYVQAGGAGGGINNSGRYIAPTATGTDTVIAVDALGRSGTAVVTILPALAITPASHTMAVTNSKTFAATGGVPPYTYTKTADTTSGTLSGAAFRAGSASGTATIRVTDSVGNISSAAVTVNAALSLSPSTIRLALRGTTTFTAANGVAPYTYSVNAGGAGGSITSGGAYTAPASGGTDTVKVTDSLGNIATSTVTILSGSSRIATGNDSACGIGISTTGVLQCWGYNGYGNLGDGTTTSHSTRQTIYAGITFSSVSAGGFNHTCGITTGGALMCWGYNAYSQLGDGTTVTHYSPEIIDSGTSYSAVAAGTHYTCAITTAGVLKCWGLNTYGNLGTGSTASETTPEVIDAGVTYSAVAISDVNYTTCAITTAGVLKCWGYNAYGEIGNGTTTSSSTPVIINTGVAYAGVALGTYHTCAITTAGVLQCWGYNAYGNLGNGTTTSSTTPVVIDAGTAYSNVTAGNQHSCAITTAGVLKCWGYNAYGQLGNGNSTSQTLPVAIDGGTTYTAVSGGGNNFTCGITSAGSFKCWGYNGYGQLGNGTTTSSNVPASVQ